MSTFKDRLFEEKAQLDERGSKLDAFINGDKFNALPDAQRSLLRIQYQAMVTYGQCLTERLWWMEKESESAVNA